MRQALEVALSQHLRHAAKLAAIAMQPQAGSGLNQQASMEKHDILPMGIADAADRSGHTVSKGRQPSTNKVLQRQTCNSPKYASL